MIRNLPRIRRLYIVFSVLGAISLTAFQNCSGHFSSADSHSLSQGTTQLPGSGDQSISTCADLQAKLLALESTGGGTLTLSSGTTLTCQGARLTYKTQESVQALVIPEKVELDLNAGTLLLNFSGSNIMGVRLASFSTIRNGTIRSIGSEYSGYQAVWHSLISIGQANGIDTSVSDLNYFQSVSNWRVEDLTLDQPFAHSVIAIMAGVHDGVIQRVKILDSDQALIGISMDWSDVGGVTTADAQISSDRIKFDAGTLYTTHPHDILVKDIQIGKLTRGPRTDLNGEVDYNYYGGDYAGVRLSACYRISIVNVSVEEAGSGVTIVGGDPGFEFARDSDKANAHADDLVDNLSIGKSHIDGISVDGFADNIYRAHLNYGYDNILNTMNPGILRLTVRNSLLRGDGSATSNGIYLASSTGATIENVDVAQYGTGVHIEGSANNAVLKGNKIWHNLHDGLDVQVSNLASITAVPTNLSVISNQIFNNGVGNGSWAGARFMMGDGAVVQKNNIVADDTQKVGIFVDGKFLNMVSDQ